MQKPRIYSLENRMENIRHWHNSCISFMWVSKRERGWERQWLWWEKDWRGKHPVCSAQRPGEISTMHSSKFWVQSNIYTANQTHPDLARQVSIDVNQEEEGVRVEKGRLFLCDHDVFVSEAVEIWSMDVPTGLPLVAAWCPWATDVWSWCWCPICPAIEADGEQLNISELLEVYHPRAQQGR